MIKRVFILVLSAIFFILDRGAWFIFEMIGFSRPGRCNVLYYHGVGYDEQKMFARQMDEILKFGKTIPADFKGKLEEKTNYTSVTFDDGFENIINFALPELFSRKIHATIFIPTGHIGKDAGWMKSKNGKFSTEQVMSANQIRELQINDLVSIGSHTMSHLSLLKLTRDEIQKELVDSRQTLERILGEDVKILSFPHGDFSEEILTLAKSAGYERVYSILPKPARFESGNFVIDRVNTNPDEWIWEFRLKIRGAYRWLVYAFKIKAVIRDAIKGRSCVNSLRIL